ncbi:amidohydrolase [Alkalibacterium subtropicum]|uniref:Amidohydrolase n=1 Tax=Alkalibacterium subtropicum TaxID=753702 RepID=A0A1I1JCN1_9LACT|nr:amidohydrolase [Alkalibacterium subtropicum]SFC46304.1 amidohydrolase [Alkalibacterium subtropicum]
MDHIPETLTQHRRNLHQIPELSFHEYKTTDYIRTTLDDLSIPYFTPLDTATVVFFEGRTVSKETIGFRADIDALPIQEETEVPFKSQHDGAMHACGHDGHTSILLTFAEWCKEKQDEGKLEKNILLIFQPSEESNAGADALIRAFPFEDYQVKEIYGLHLGPDIPEHTLATKPGFLMASATEYRINVKGLSAHVAQKEKGHSALGAVTHIATQLGQVQQYFLNGLHQNILHIGKLHAGEAINTVATDGHIQGTIRTYVPEDLIHIQEKMETIVAGTDALFGTETTLDFAKGYPAVYNDESLMDTVQAGADQAGLTLELLAVPYLFGEDFSFYSSIAKTNFAFLGVRNEEKGYIHGLHTALFNFDEKILLNGVKYYQAIASTLGLIR